MENVKRYDFKALHTLVLCYVAKNTTEPPRTIIDELLTVSSGTLRSTKTVLTYGNPVSLAIVAAK